jgi:hypothetical protein
MPCYWAWVVCVRAMAAPTTGTARYFIVYYTYNYIIICYTSFIVITCMCAHILVYLRAHMHGTPTNSRTLVTRGTSTETGSGRERQKERVSVGETEGSLSPPPSSELLYRRRAQSQPTNVYVHARQSQNSPPNREPTNTESVRKCSNRDSVRDSKKGPTGDIRSSAQSRGGEGGAGGAEREEVGPNLDDFVLPPRVSSTTRGGSFGGGGGGALPSRSSSWSQRSHISGPPNEVGGSGNVLSRGKSFRVTPWADRVRELAHERGDFSPMSSRLALPLQSANDSASGNGEGLVLLPRRHLQELLPAAAGGLPRQQLAARIAAEDAVARKAAEEAAARQGLEALAIAQGFFILTFFFGSV